MAKFLDKFKCFAAFTLAETLIVMGIIGVVAALTIPNLNSSTADKEKVAKVKKVYSNFVDAYGRMEAVYGPFIDTINNQDLDTKPAELAQTLGDRLTEFMKTSKNCERKSNNGCFTNKILDLDGSVDSLSGVVGDSATTTYKIYISRRNCGCNFSLIWWNCYYFWYWRFAEGIKYFWKRLVLSCANIRR